MNGIDIVTVKELMGHKTIEMMLRYAHLSPDHKRFAVDSLCKENERQNNDQQVILENNKLEEHENVLGNVKVVN